MNEGFRVRDARIYLGLSQDKLATLVGVSQPAISQIENTGSVSEAVLDRIARQTGFATWWFRLGPLPDLPSGSLRFRKRRTAAADDERIRIHVRQAIELLERLSPNVNLPHVRVRPVTSDEVAVDSIEEWASAAREWLGVGPLGPIANVIRAAERSGIVVVGSMNEIENHDAASFWRSENEHPMVCFTRGYPGDRQRFSIGHEIGHLVLHHLRTVNGKQAEAEADRFAGALLIPREVALQEIDPPVTLTSLAYVKARWGISIAALIRRSLDLGIIDAQRRLSLEKQLSSRGWRKQEPVEVPEEFPVLMSKIIKANTPAGKTRGRDVTGLPPMARRALVA